MSHLTASNTSKKRNSNDVSNSCTNGKAPLVECNEKKPTKQAKVDLDPGRISARLKQIAFGKNTVGYDYYIAAVPR